MENPHLRDRAAKFASLQAAHRALARSVHPNELAAVKQQSRELLIQLQATSGDAADAGDGMAAQDPVRLRAVDEALNEQGRRIRDVLARVELSQLRASLPQLVRQHRDEVQGLLDVMLDGELDDGKTMRTLEYVITLLATEERGGRRVAVHEASQVSEQLARRAAAELGSEREESCLVAERVLEDATVQVLQDGDVGEIRDRVRRYKEELGSALLHPRVLAAAVAYNTAMWNHTAAEIDSSRAIEQLAEELFSAAAAGGPKDAARRHPAVDGPAGGALYELVTAFRARALGEAGETGDTAAERLAAALDLHTLRAEDVELFSEAQADETTALMREATVLGLLLRASEQDVGAASADCGLDREGLRELHVPDLADRMNEHARKLFADSQYSDAFRISDVRTHSLAALLVARGGPPDGSAARSPAHRPGAERASGLKSFLRQLATAPRIVGLILAGALVAVLLSPPLLGERDDVGTGDLSTISPFLVSGRTTEAGAPLRFVGYVSPTWDYVATEGRRRAVEEIGRKMSEAGVPRVVLMSPDGQVLARYHQGEIVLLVPYDATAAEDDLEAID